ncbi:hypothetical protein EYF80_037496 [Liparis tanakae]|uniref:Uncharacterized protein n=1 Tax=Liparis tanakae TaxID=230148 RepID=A0A4Z2GFU1_9TELE|nr:hypothetical protein EYF80_037496 [Liparis tanakae]
MGCSSPELGGTGGDDVIGAAEASSLTSCNCSSSFLRMSWSSSRSAYRCFSAWFSSRTTSPHSAARTFSRFASPSSWVSRSNSARY